MLDWAALNAENSLSSVFLFKLSHDSHGYEALVTDCVSIWKESLSNADIIQRAQDTECSIDPAHDGSQLAVLCEKLYDALSSRTGSRLVVDNSAGHGILILQASCPLPKPFAPFQWSLKLHLQGPDKFRAQVFLPLTQKCLAQQNQINDLAALLAEKDEAIAKILDKIESAGLDPTTVFPTASRAKAKGRATTRAQLLQQVKGLRPFDRREWGARPTYRSSSISQEQLLEAALRELTSYHDVSQPSSSPSPPQPPSKNVGDAQPTPEPGGTSENEEYQMQETPPSRKRNRDEFFNDSARQSPRTGPPPDDETTDEDDDEQSFPEPLTSPSGNSQRPPSPRAHVVPSETIPINSDPTTRHAKLGVLKARRKPENSHVAPDKLSILSDSMPSEDYTLDEARPRKTLSPPRVPGGPLKQRRKLGMIGGKDISSAVDSAANYVQGQDHHEIDVPSRQFETSGCVSLGLQQSEPLDASHLSLSKAPGNTATDDQSSTAIVFASDEQKADQKRAALKHQLEKQTKAPSKRKRKF